MKLTDKQLKKFIKEYQEMLAKGHIDGQPWSGTLEDLATIQGGTWGGGDVVDPKEFKGLVSLAKDYSKGTVKGMLEMKITAKQLRKIIQEEIHSLNETWPSGARGYGRKDVTPEVAKLYLGKIKDRGANRKMMYGDVNAALRWIDSNYRSWSRTSDMENAIIRYLVSKGFGQPINYR